MSMKLERLQAGQYIPGCRTHNRYVRAECAEDMWCVSVGSPSMSSAELETLRSSGIRFATALFEENLFFLFRFGEAPWVSAPFEPRVCADGLPPDGAPMVFAFLDSDSGVALGVRTVPLGADASAHILRACGALLGRPYDRADCLRLQTALLRQYPTGEELLRAGGACAVFSLAQA